jgi:hypothetical protein
MSAREKKKLVDRILRFVQTVDETTSDALADPIHEEMYVKDIQKHFLKALKLLSECVKVLEER